MRSTSSKCINVTVVQSNHYATLVELVNNPTIIPIISMEKPQSNSKVIEGKIYIWLITFEFSKIFKYYKTWKYCNTFKELQKVLQNLKSIAKIIVIFRVAENLFKMCYSLLNFDW